MKEAKIRILNAQLMIFKDKETGEVKEMTKIEYQMEMAKIDNRIGPAILKCSRPGDLLSKLSNMVGLNNSVVTAVIDERPTENGSKYVLTKINNQEI